MNFTTTTKFLLFITFQQVVLLRKFHCIVSCSTFSASHVPPQPEVRPPTSLAVAAKSSPSMRQYSVQALVMLAELTATLLDLVYRSEEKERVVPLLHSLLYNVFPYLKNHRYWAAVVPLHFETTNGTLKMWSYVTVVAKRQQTPPLQ